MNDLQGQKVNIL